VKFLATGTNYTQGIFNPVDPLVLNDCIYDQAGYDLSWALTFLLAINCTIKNTGSTAAGIAPVFITRGYPSIIANCFFTDIRGAAVQSSSYSLSITDSVIANCAALRSIWLNGGAQDRSVVVNRVTINGGAGSAVYLDGSANCFNVAICNCILSNNGLYGIDNQTGVSLASMGAVLIDYNDFYNNTSGARNNVPAGAHDLALDPQFTNAAGGDYTIGTNLKAQGYPSLLGAQ